MDTLALVIQPGDNTFRVNTWANAAQDAARMFSEVSTTTRAGIFLGALLLGAITLTLFAWLRKGD